MFKSMIMVNVFSVFGLFVYGCNDASNSNEDTDSGADTSSDADTGADSNSDTAAETDADTNSDTTPDTETTTGEDTDVVPVEGNLLPAEGQSMTQNWLVEPYTFGAWYTYCFHTGTTIDPAAGIKTTDGKMCATLAGTQIAAGGGAIGFDICAAPIYPNDLGEYSWFPLNCTDNPAETCIPSETKMPASFCGLDIAGVTVKGSGIINKVEFKGPGDGPLTGGAPGSHSEVIPDANGYAAIPDGLDGSSVTAIHIKSFNDGEMCIESVVLTLN